MTTRRCRGTRIGGGTHRFGLAPRLPQRVRSVDARVSFGRSVHEGTGAGAHTEGQRRCSGTGLPEHEELLSHVQEGDGFDTDGISIITRIRGRAGVTKSMGTTGMRTEARVFALIDRSAAGCALRVAVANVHDPGAAGADVRLRTPEADRVCGQLFEDPAFDEQRDGGFSSAAGGAGMRGAPILGLLTTRQR